MHVHAVYCKHMNLSFKKNSTLTALNESIDGILWNLEMSPSKWQAALSVTADVPAECRQNQIKNRTNVSNGIFIGKINLSTRVKQFSKNKIYNLKIIQMH